MNPPPRGRPFMVGFPTSYLLDFAKGLAREPFPVSLDVDHPLASLARALRGGAAREAPDALQQRSPRRCGPGRRDPGFMRSPVLSASAAASCCRCHCAPPLSLPLLRIRVALTTCGPSSQRERGGRGHGRRHPTVTRPHWLRRVRLLAGCHVGVGPRNSGRISDDGVGVRLRCDRALARLRVGETACGRCQRRSFPSTSSCRSCAFERGTIRSRSLAGALSYAHGAYKGRPRFSCPNCLWLGGAVVGDADASATMTTYIRGGPWMGLVASRLNG